MKSPGKNPGCGNRGKTNCVFPPFPQPLLLVINKDEKQLTLKTEDRLHKIFDATPCSTKESMTYGRARTLPFFFSRFWRDVDVARRTRAFSSAGVHTV